MIETIIIAAIIITGIIACEIDSFVGGGLTFLGLLAAAQLWFAVPVWATITAAPVVAVLALVVYTAVGLVYAVLIRFPRFLASRQDQITSAWGEHIRNNPSDTGEDFRASYRFRPYTAAANDHRIASWAMLWPWGLAWDAANRPVRWMYRVLAKACAGLLARAERRAILKSFSK